LTKAGVGSSSLYKSKQLRVRHRIINTFLSNTSNKASVELDINYFFSYFCLSKKALHQDDNDCSCEPAQSHKPPQGYNSH